MIELIITLALVSLTVALYSAVGIRDHLERLQKTLQDQPSEAITERCPAPDDWEAIEQSTVRTLTPIPESVAVGQDYQPRNCLPPPAPHFWGEDEP